MPFKWLVSSFQLNNNLKIVNNLVVMAWNSFSVLFYIFWIIFIISSLFYIIKTL